MADEIVIRDHAGNEHVFPAGFDPVKAAGIVREQNTAAGLSPLGDTPASVPADTWSKGFHQSLNDQAKASMAGGTDFGVGRLPATVVGLAEGIPSGVVHGAVETLKLPFTLLKSVAGGTASLLTDPEGTLTRLRDTAAGLPAAAKEQLNKAIQFYQDDPEGFAKAAGEMGGAVAGGELASKIPLKPGIRLAGRGLEAASEHPFAARMAGGSMVGRGILKGDPLTAGTGIALMGAPKLLNKVGRAMREYGGDNLSAAIPSGARTLDVGDTSGLKGIRVQPPAGTVRPQPTGASPKVFGARTAAPPVAPAAPGVPTVDELIKKGLTPDQAAQTVARIQARAGSIRPQGAPQPVITAPVTPVETAVEDAQRGYMGTERRGATGTSPTGVERRSGASGGTVAERAANLRAEGITPPASKPEGAAMVNKAIQDARNGSVRTTPPAVTEKAADLVDRMKDHRADVEHMGDRLGLDAEDTGVALKKKYPDVYAGFTNNQMTTAVRAVRQGESGLASGNHLKALQPYIDAAGTPAEARMLINKGGPSGQKLNPATMNVYKKAFDKKFGPDWIDSSKDQYD